MKIMQEGSNGCRSDGNCSKFVVLFFQYIFHVVIRIIISPNSLFPAKNFWGIPPPTRRCPGPAGDGDLHGLQTPRHYRVPLQHNDGNKTWIRTWFTVPFYLTPHHPPPIACTYVLINTHSKENNQFKTKNV